MATSTIPAFIDALVARLQSDAGLLGVQVSDGFPFPGPIEREVVLVLGATPDDPTGTGQGGQHAAALGRQSREERYVVDVVVSVTKSSRETQSATRARAFQVAAALENSIRNWGGENPSFGGIVRWAQVMGTGYEPPADSDTREARVTVPIACAQRI